ncbi:MAG: tRNA (guanosine(37)-N1)-methyltransferase TrmD [Actinomycetota bacterium]|nr:tRNA (guanosine(37)-N1)-methyltransferase TrmD [Actinomycetota bacterium]
MKIDVITLFPQLFDAPLRTSLLGRAIEQGLLEIGVVDLRPFGIGPHLSVDDEPYGGGAGMVMRPEPIFAAVESVATTSSRLILMSARGERLVQGKVERLSRLEHIVLVCGRYEGVDQRVSDELVHDEISIGDFVLAGGELAALVVIEAVSRLVPGVLGNPDSLLIESHSSGSLEFPQYTRPADFRGHRVPDVLLSGDHAAIAAWRQRESEQLTRSRSKR